MIQKTSFENLRYAREGSIGILTIYRPKALNALNKDLLVELNRAVDMIAVDRSIDVLVITGEGKSFVAGADITEMKDMNSEQGREWGELGASVFMKIEKLKVPVIAAVNGFALGGGCELAMCCDIRIASENAKFGQPEVGLGITPGFSGCIRLPRIVGAAKAKELIFTGDQINAAEALKIGLVNSVVAPEALMETALAMAKKIASRAQLAVVYSKMAIDRGLQSDVDTAASFENQVFGLCFATADQKEGMTAFTEKRAAVFTKK